jgi:hypothetical protein
VNLVKGRLVTYEEAIPHPTSPSDLPGCFAGSSGSAQKFWAPAVRNPILEHLAMTNSRSNASRTKLLTVLAVLCAMLGAGGVAQAGRKRVVVLAFEGPKGDKFHDDLVKLIKKTHTVVPTDKWNGTAEELDAGALSEKNVKKVAKKLKVDAIVEGKIEKRRDEFIIRLKLREGKSGEVIGNPIDTKADGPQIDGRAQRDLKDELVDAIGNVESNHLGGSISDDDDDKSPKKAAKKTDDDEDDKPVVKKAAKKTDDDEDDKPVVKKAAKKTDDDEDDDKSPKKGFAKRNDDERGGEKVKKTAAKKTDDDDDKLPPKKTAAKKTDDDDDKLPPKKTAAAKKTDDDDKLPPKKTVAAKKTADDDDDDKKPVKKKKVASSDEESSTEIDSTPAEALDAEAALSPGERALDAVLGVSVTARRLTFAVRSGLMALPPAYKGAPVGGAMIDATVYPLAVGHKRADMLKNIGLDVMYDRVLKVNSKDATGKQFASSESRFGIGGVFRYPFGRTATAPVVLGSLGYSSQSFTISGGTTIGIPSVKYSIFEPGAGIRFPVIPKLIVNLDAKFMVITNTGEIQGTTQYGAASVIGFEGALGADYMITPNIFARAAFRAETIGYKFKGTGMLSNARDGDPTSKDVTGARDTYLGGMVTVGYAY